MSQKFVVDDYTDETKKVPLDKFSYYDYADVDSIDTNENAINNSIKNIIMTRIGSLPGKPEFGSNVLNIVFDLMDNNSTDDILKNNIVSSLIKWEPRISINNIIIKQIPEYNRIIVDIKYSYNILGGNINASTTILLKD